MTKYTVEINDDELGELQEIVADILEQQPTSKITEEGYLQQMISGFLQDRIRNFYVASVRQNTIAELKTKLGTKEDIKSGN